MAKETIKVNISPLTRIEGHLAIHTHAEKIPGGGSKGYRITGGHCIGEMFRGFENLLAGRDPLDVPQITQRICGVCPISHATASVGAIQMAYGVPPTANGQALQNLILAANFIQSHVLHFYQLSALDFVDVTAVLTYSGKNPALLRIKKWVTSAVSRKDIFAGAPLLPRYEAEYINDAEINCQFLANYLQALEIRKIAHEAGAVFGGKLPHSTAIVPGGCTQKPTMERILAFRSRFKKILAFVEDTYLPDIYAAAALFPDYLTIGCGYDNFLAFGAFPATPEATETPDITKRFFPGGLIRNGRLEALDIEQIREDVGQSHYASPSGKHPRDGRTKADPNTGYSWIKAPRYAGSPMEVGPLARVMVGYHANSWIKQEVDTVLSSSQLKFSQLKSLLGRHLCRCLEVKWVAKQALKWLDELDPNEAPAARLEALPREAEGYGLTEAPRGALIHWLKIRNSKVDHFQAVVPTTWNCSPRDDNGTAGPVEKALEGVIVTDPANPVEAGRVVRSFDPCIACAVH